MARIPGTKISYDLGSNVLFDNLDYAQNFLILHDKTQLHKQLFYRFSQHFSDKGGINLFASTKHNRFLTNSDIRNSTFTTLNTEAINKIKQEINKCVDDATKENKPALLICDWAGANISSSPANSGGGGGPNRSR